MVVKVQAQVRSFIARAKFVRMLNARKTAAVTAIQAVIRGGVIREDLKFKSFAAGEIQRMWRGSNQQVKFILMVLAGIRIQSAARMFLVKGDLKYKG